MNPNVNDRWVLPALFLLGCYHGINPGMGWLFAVALGLQERTTRAVLAAIAPIAIGHVISVTIVVFVAVFAALTFPHAIVHRVAALLLFAFGTYKLVRARHPRWVGMRVGFWGLMLWGFLMASAHGAGLMLLPFVTSSFSPSMHNDSTMNMTMPEPAQHGYVGGWIMIVVHTLGYLLTMTAVAVIVYRFVGLRFLRSSWFNVDAGWAIALIITGAIALLT